MTVKFTSIVPLMASCFCLSTTVTKATSGKIMAKQLKTYRFNVTDIQKLKLLAKQLGVTQTALIENALANFFKLIK